MVVEVVSPDDESWLKFDHDAEHGVDEVLIADPQCRMLDLFVPADGGYERRDHSAVLDVAVAELHAAIDWPGPPAPASSA
jgi:Uma2 family endonuclease